MKVLQLKLIFFYRKCSSCVFNSWTFDIQNTWNLFFVVANLRRCRCVSQLFWFSPCFVFKCEESVSGSVRYRPVWSLTPVFPFSLFALTGAGGHHGGPQGGGHPPVSRVLPSFLLTSSVPHTPPASLSDSPTLYTQLPFFLPPCQPWWAAPTPVLPAPHPPHVWRPRYWTDTQHIYG